MKAVVLTAITFLLIAALPLTAEESSSPEAEIHAAVASYVTAFNAHDAAALAALWSPEAVYVSRSSGEQITGQASLREEFAAFFEQSGGIRLEAETEAVQFISPNTAVEHGTARVFKADEEPEVMQYSAVYLRLGGKWLLDRVTEETVQPNARHQELQRLEWLIGSWTDQTDEITVEIESDWTRNDNYIARKYHVTRDGELQSSGLQIIGWDPQQETIRSWLFDSDGGFIDGVWTEAEGQWHVQSTATLADGGSGSFTSVFLPIDENSYGWKKVNQSVDGQLLPNLDETIVTRH